MEEAKIAWNEKVAVKIIKNLEKRRMEGSYAPTGAQAKEEVLAMIPGGATVFRCGSMTAGGLGLWEDIANLPDVELIDPADQRDTPTHFPGKLPRLLIGPDAPRRKRFRDITTVGHDQLFDLQRAAAGVIGDDIKTGGVQGIVDLLIVW